MKKAIFMVLGLVFVLNLIGCETVKGFGKDLQNTGENIKETVDKI